jgi:NADPH:quinone reductase-like Zn-dependent oxidoreductase
MSTHTVFRLPGSSRKSIRDIEARQEQIPEPAPQEVLIRVRSVALNYRDHAIASGFYPFPVKEDIVPCSDLAGDVVSVGSEVKDFQKGDKVIVNFDLKTLSGPIVGWSASQGGPVDGVLRQHVSVPSSFVTKIPADTKLSYSQLASIVCTGTTAWNALYGNNPLKPGQTVLFLGKSYTPARDERSMY